mgnify:CR=1 FL=1
MAPLIAKALDAALLDGTRSWHADREADVILDAAARAAWREIRKHVSITDL